MTTTIASSLFFFLIALAVLITFHEWGHYWVAKKLGVKVLKFSVGFGKVLWSRRVGPDNTEFALAAIPLGGYVQMLDEREASVSEHERHRAFNRQSLGKRSAIVFAGPLANFLLAIALYLVMYLIGVPGLKPVIGEIKPDSPAAQAGLLPGATITAIGDRPITSWESGIFALLEESLAKRPVVIHYIDVQGTAGSKTLDLSHVPGGIDQGNLLENIGLTPARLRLPAILDKLDPAGAAAKAGLKTQDKIIAADGVPIKDWESWVEYVRARPGQAIAATVQRGDERVQISITPVPTAEGNLSVGKIGTGVYIPENLQNPYHTIVRYGPIDALSQALNKTWEMSALTINLLVKMIVGEVSIKNLSGPISIAQYAGVSAAIGFVSFLSFLALVSVSLGVLNLLPIPLLDGGHLFFYAIEWIKGGPLSEQAQLIGQKIGIALLGVLMVFAFYNDLARLFG